METLCAFPSINNPEFERACEAVSSRFDLRGHLQNEWANVEVVRQGAVHLKITKLLPEVIQQDHSIYDEADDEVLEDDEEALIAQSNIRTGLSIEYHIFLSPSYQVPVLYLILRDHNGVVPPTLNTLYNQVIPEHYKTQVRNFGVIGGITRTDHPVTQRPVFFVHPCNTAEALQASLGDRKLTADQYILLWIGLAGGCVGLQVPSTIAMGQIDGTRPKSD